MILLLQGGPPWMASRSIHRVGPLRRLVLSARRRALGDRAPASRYDEKDRLDPVNPAAALKLDEARLSSFPVGYRHLAYLQSSGGANITPDLALHNTPSQEKLYAASRDWLNGAN